MTPEQAVEKAIEAGYKTEFADQVINGKSGQVEKTYVLNGYVILLDPLFWQALGKAERWTHVVKLDVAELRKIGNTRAIEDSQLEWHHRWHELIDHLAEGNTITEYFEGL